MNYRHAFHAGNFADIFKHAALLAAQAWLVRKPAPVTFADTHGGAGLYDLSGGEAARGAEWQDGAARLAAAADPPPIVRPLIDAIRVLNDGSDLRLYPGSPWLIARGLRENDRALVCEAHGPTAALLRAAVRHPRLSIREGDGYAALRDPMIAQAPRALILIDPPFEDRAEFATLAGALVALNARAPRAAVLAWYPVKHRPAVDAFLGEVASSGVRDVLAAELAAGPAADDGPMRSCGLLMIGAPFGLVSALERDGAALAALLAQAPGGGFRLTRLTPE